MAVCGEQAGADVSVRPDPDGAPAIAAAGERPIRLAVVLPGLHRVNRGAEVALESVSAQLARLDDFQVTLFGSGGSRPGDLYSFCRVRNLPRERFRRWPRLPFLRSDTVYEELTSLWDLRRAYRHRDFDVTLTCSFPYTNIFLRRGRRDGWPRHVFVTQNGDWPCFRRNREYRMFGCDLLVCTNPEYLAAHREQYRCALAPNGVDVSRFDPARARRREGAGRLRVLMVSALIESKRVREAIEAVSRCPNLELCVAGNGPLACEIDQLGSARMGDRFRRVSVEPSRMPDLYASSDVVLHMSLSEPFGNVFVESMAMGVPVVAHDCPNHRWILGGFGALVDTTDPESVRAAIDRVSSAACDRADARRRVCAEFSWEAVGARYATAIRELVDS
jgi:glycosyltransferase involved in cell wall biosynthesis